MQTFIYGKSLTIVNKAGVFISVWEEVDVRIYIDKMDALAVEVKRPSLEDRIADLRLDGILDSEEDARQLIYEIARCGLEVNKKSVLTQIVYQSLGIPKNDMNMPYYKEGNVLMDGHTVAALETFQKNFSDVDLEVFNDVDKVLIDWAFGERIYNAFKYVQKKMNSTGFQRVGGEELEDAYIVVHSLRVAGKSSQNNDTWYQILVDIFHDIFEDMGVYRLKKWQEIDANKKDYMENRIPKNARRLKSTQETISNYNREMNELEQQIKNPPEYNEVHEILEREFLEQYDGNKAEALAQLGVYHLRLLTRELRIDGKEDYTDYVLRLQKGSNDGVVRDLLTKAGIDPDSQEAQKFYETPLKAKGMDGFDNTERLKELAIGDKSKRLRHNILIISAIDEYMGRNPYSSGFKETRDELMRISRVNLREEIRYFGDDPNRHIQRFVGDLRDLKPKYGVHEGFGEKVFSVIRSLSDARLSAVTFNF